MVPIKQVLSTTKIYLDSNIHWERLFTGFIMPQKIRFPLSVINSVVLTWPRQFFAISILLFSCPIWRPSMMKDSNILSSSVFPERLPFPRTVLFYDFLKMESPNPFHFFSSLQKLTHQNPSSICQTCFLQPLLDQKWHLQVLLSGKSCALILLLQAHRASSDVEPVDFSHA